MPVFAYKDLPKLLAQLEKGRPAPIYLITGDPFLIRTFYQELIDRLIPKEQQAFNLELVDGEKEDVRTIIERMQTFPFLPGPKAVVVKNPLPLFDVANEERLWKKAEEAWGKGDRERALRLLRSLLTGSGISVPPVNKEDFPGKKPGRTKFPSGRDENLPPWLKEALVHLKELPEEESPPQSQAQTLEEAVLVGFPPNHFLIILLEGSSGSKKIVKTISQVGAVCNLSVKQEKKGEQTATLKGLLRNRLSVEGKTIHPQAEALLLDRVGPEPSVLEMEIQKLVLYLGERKQIEPQDVLEMTGGFREEPIYELTAVLGERKPIKAVEMLNQLEEQGYLPLQILGAMANFFRRLLTAREALKSLPPLPRRLLEDYGPFSTRVLPLLKESPAGEFFSQTHPFVIYNTLKTAQTFSQSQLYQAFTSLQVIDRLMKTSGADPSLLLQDFILRFCQQEES